MRHEEGKALQGNEIGSGQAGSERTDDARDQRADARVDSGAGAGTPPPAVTDVDLTYAPDASSSGPQQSKSMTIRKALADMWLSGEFISFNELAQKHGWSAAAVRSIASKMRSEGNFPKSRQSAPGSAPEPAKPVVVQPKAVRELLKELEGVEKLSGDHIEKVLSTLALHSPMDATKVAAAKALNEISRQTGQQVGPPNPMDAEEKVERLRALIVGSGKEVGSAAIERAMEDWKAEAEAEAGAQKRSAGITA